MIIGHIERIVLQNEDIIRNIQIQDIGFQRQLRNMAQNKQASKKSKDLSLNCNTML